MPAVEALVVIDRPATPPPSDRVVADFLAGHAHVWHGGLADGLGEIPVSLTTVRPRWMLDVEPVHDVPAVSWRLSFDGCLVRAAAVRAVGAPDPGFDTRTGSGLEWGFRLVRFGAIVLNHPAVADRPRRVPVPPTALDGLRLVALHYGRFWRAWAAMRAVRLGALRRRADLVRLPELVKVTACRAPAEPLIRPAHGDRAAVKAAWDGRVSILVPTLRRYGYLRTLIDQIAAQTVVPLEVIVVDQTPAASRETVTGPGDHGIGFTVIALDHIGQCTARNEGLRVVAGDHVLFLDDDDEIPPDLIERHVVTLDAIGADGSCGGVDEDGVGALPPEFAYIHVADLFPTNNTLLRTEALRTSGLFDLQFDGGTNEDHDLGVRLYRSGQLLMFNPEPRVFHHRASQGGLRHHGQRVVTRARSRRSLVRRRLPTVTETYLLLKYQSNQSVHESELISAMATLSHDGGRLARLGRLVVATALLPDTWHRIRAVHRGAEALLAAGPQVPELPTALAAAPPAPTDRRAPDPSTTAPATPEART